MPAGSRRVSPRGGSLVDTRPPAGVRATRVPTERGELVVFSFPDGRGAAPGAGRTGSGLTEAEQEVLGLVLAGLSTAEIAAHRATSVRTVSKQIDATYKKLGVHSRAELAARYG